MKFPILKNTYILNCFLYDSGVQKTLQVYERVSTWPRFTGGYVTKQEVGRKNETMMIPCGSLLQNTTSGLQNKVWSLNLTAEPCMALRVHLNTFQPS